MVRKGEGEEEQEEEESDDNDEGDDDDEGGDDDDGDAPGSAPKLFRITCTMPSAMYRPYRTAVAREGGRGATG